MNVVIALYFSAVNQVSDICIPVFKGVTQFDLHQHITLTVMK